MIIEIDHVAISSERLEDQHKILTTLGYVTDLSTAGIKNLHIKKKLMRDYSELQDLKLLRSNHNIGIEFVNHKTVNSNQPYIFPIFENVPNDLIESANEKRISDLILKSHVKFFDIPIYVLNHNIKSKFRFNKIIIKTSNIENSLDFWKYFGFKTLCKDEKYSHIEFRSILTRDDFHIYLEKDQTTNIPHFLDDSGFNCIAFISNSAKNEKKLLEKNKIKTTAIEKIELNKKSLEIFFALGSQGEIVEVISPEKT